MNKKLIITAAFLGSVAIVLGAFGAHALKKVLDTDALQTFEVGVRYQMYHALFLLGVGATPLVTEKTKKTILWLVSLGVLLFSGSIYLLATQQALGINFSFLGPITPIGGLLLIAAWVLLCWKAVQ
ncbi:MAG: DUF423 domain-containing protein, partial [Flavobacterium sp.]|nr:DUF423 domain-containing protein [Candidatus Neoflavobacterium equi]